MTHRRQVNLDTVAIRLPASWWIDPDESGGTIRVDHVAFLSNSPNQVEFFPLAPEKRKADDASAQAWQFAFVNAVHLDALEPVEFVGTNVRVYCVRDAHSKGPGLPGLLVCRIPGSVYGVGYGGSASGELTAERLLSNLINIR